LVKMLNITQSDVGEHGMRQNSLNQGSELASIINCCFLYAFAFGPS